MIDGMQAGVGQAELRLENLQSGRIVPDLLCGEVCRRGIEDAVVKQACANWPV